MLALAHGGVDVHLRLQQTHTEQLLIQAVKYFREALPSDAVDEVGDGGMVEHWVVDAEETKPAIADILRDGRAQSAEGGDVVNGAEGEISAHRFGMDGGAAEVRTVSLFQRGDKLGEVQLLVNPDQQVVGVDKVS